MPVTNFYSKSFARLKQKGKIIVQMVFVTVYWELICSSIWWHFTFMFIYLARMNGEHKRNILCVPY